MPRQPKLRPKTNIPGLPENLYDLTAVAQLSELECQQEMEEKPQRVFRVKRKHVLKACDRCRIKKTKCDGKQPCNRCAAYNHPCLFRERKATQTRVYSKGYVELLESSLSMSVKGLQSLHRICVDNNCFPGEPLQTTADGHPLTHDILDRMGLIKQAEESPEDPSEEFEDLQYLRYLSSNSTDSATTDPSPEPATPPQPTSSICSPVESLHKPFKWEVDMLPTTQAEPQQQQNYQYSGYSGAGFHAPQHQQQAHSGLIMPRLSLDTTVSLGNDIPSCTSTCTSATLPSTATSHHDTPLTSPYMYYAEDPSTRIHPPMMLPTGLDANAHTQPQPHSQTAAAGLPIDILNAYQQHLSSLQEQQQPMYAALATGWTFPLDR